MKIDLKAVIFTLIAAGIAGVVDDGVYKGLTIIDKKFRKADDEDNEDMEESETE